MVVGGPRVQERFRERMPFDALEPRLEFGDRAHPRSGAFPASAQEGVDVRGVVAADLVAGEDDQIGMRLPYGGVDQADRILAHMRTILDVGHLQHTERAVAVESQAHDAHCNAANLDMG